MKATTVAASLLRCAGGGIKRGRTEEDSKETTVSASKRGSAAAQKQFSSYERLFAIGNVREFLARPAEEDGGGESSAAPTRVEQMRQFMVRHLSGNVALTGDGQVISTTENPADADAENSSAGTSAASSSGETGSTSTTSVEASRLSADAVETSNGAENDEESRVVEEEENNAE